jgi:uncharacterized protein (DUF4415 family)
MSDRTIAGTSPPELADLPADFWDEAEVVVPPAKQAVSLRLDLDVLDWFKQQGPKYQTRINAVLRSYVSRARGHGRTSPSRRTRKNRKSPA